jgi:8-oxo-dGTP diphosphatase
MNPIPTRAVKAVIYKLGKILILQRNPKIRGVDNWDLPGGLVEVDESESDALKREVREELGVEVMNPRLSASWSFIREIDNQTVQVHNYTCELAQEDTTPVLSDEHVGYKWIKPQDITRFAIKDASLVQAILGE